MITAEEIRQAIQDGHAVHACEIAQIYLREVCEQHVEQRLATWTDIRDAMDVVREADRAYMGACGC